MNVMAKAADRFRSSGDPSIIKSGPSSRGLSDRAGNNLGWFSIGLGLAELLFAERMTRMLGMEGREGLIRAYGVRELMAGMTCLSVDRTLGTWSRVAGDAVDIATLLSAYTNDNPKKSNVGLALAAVAGITLLDIATAQGLTVRHRRKPQQWRDYSDRSGWPNGLSASRGAAADFRTPDDMRATPRAAAASKVTGRTSPAAMPLVNSAQGENSPVPDRSNMGQAGMQQNEMTEFGTEQTSVLGQSDEETAREPNNPGPGERISKPSAIMTDLS
jgi:hypothetical protein